MAGHIPDSLSVDWCTPENVCQAVRQSFEGTIELDPCSNVYSKVKANNSFTLENGLDGLILPWIAKTTYVNPPFGNGWYKLDKYGKRLYIWPNQRKELISVYGKQSIKEYTKVSIKDWIRKCSEQVDSKVIALVPAYVGTKAWQQYVWPLAKAICFPNGRLHFNLVSTNLDESIQEKTGPAPMDCAIIYWGPVEGVEKFSNAFKDIGYINILR